MVSILIWKHVGQVYFYCRMIEKGGLYWLTSAPLTAEIVKKAIFHEDKFSAKAWNSKEIHEQAEL